MEAGQISELAESCRAIAARAKMDAIAARDLAALRDADCAVRRLGRAEDSALRELRAATDAAVSALENRPDGVIQSRLDSHHWDVGFLRVESDFQVVSVIDGDVLCRDDEDELRLIGRDEVRVEFGDELPD